MLRLFLFFYCFQLSWAAAQVSTGRRVGKSREAALTKLQAEEMSASLIKECLAGLRKKLQAEWDAGAIRQEEHVLHFKYHVFGKKPIKGRSLYISMHGGGNASQKVNDQQWENQLRLYQPGEGVYVAPRAPTNTWNLWHEAHIDSLFDKLIQAAVLFEGVNPDKVYIMGYSAGGDGVYQLAPRMADRWAAAAMMAGHPNETSPLGLRNIGFALHMGALDSAYKRNEIARQWGQMLDSLSELDPGGYKHQVQLHEGRGHWMNREDTIAVPWMSTFTRNSSPDKIVWKQDDVGHLSFYWLAVPVGSVKAGGEIIATIKENQVDIIKNYSDTLILRFNDRMADMDKPIKIRYMGTTVYHDKIKRKRSVIARTIQERKDPGLVFFSELTLVNGKIIKE